ncbi:ABC transporter ATP-binding protein [Moorena producens JHB]|uniref:ABC transporter ATP-binding protein n=1 Tax=Moorena producens (strain JHB) TaxID=1454205 RepID=A0A1D9FUN3_MOOP1|nr:ABC transporter ATP-binding protein [Moorena producens]AOY79089.1 ABC transporter ATP-binding protein [Moorena producens JHB]
MLRYIAKVLYVLGKTKKTLIILLFSFLLVSILEVFGIGLIGPFLSLASKPELIHDHSWLNLIYNHLGLNRESYFIALIGVLIVTIFCIKSFIRWRTQTNVFIFGFRQQGELATKLMGAYLAAPYTFHLGRNSANLIKTVMRETEQFANGVLMPLIILASNAIILVFLTLLLCINSLTIVVAFLAISFPVVLLFNSFKHKIISWGQQVSQSYENIIRIINHSLGGIKETQIIGCQSYFQNQIAEQARIYADVQGVFFAFKLSPRIVIETILVIFLVGVTSVFLILNQDIQELTAILSIFALASIRLIPAGSNLISGISVLRNSTYSLNKLYSDLKELENIETDNGSKVLAYPVIAEEGQRLRFTKQVVLESVNYRYPNASDNALTDISLTINKSQSIALIGKSGAGKTTLVDLILGLLKPQEGDLKVDGQSIYDDIRSWQNLIGYIPQSIFLMDDTIEKNIAFGVPEHKINYERLYQAMAAAQLIDFIEQLPNGVKTMVGERGVRFSGGQRQRIGIARSLYHEKEILVLDEATSALDNETERLVTEAIKSLSGTKTMILIAHRLSTVEHCDRIYLMDKGYITKSGSYQEVVLEKY